RNTGTGFAAPETLCPVPALCPYDNLYEGRALGIDLDGDGRSELLASFSPADNPDPDETVNTRFYAIGTWDNGAATAHAAWPLHGLAKWIFQDINGDGLPDAALADLDSTTLQVRYNTGRGFGPVEKVATDIRPFEGRRVFQSLDIDSDGRMDLLSLSEADAQ